MGDIVVQRKIVVKLQVAKIIILKKIKQPSDVSCLM